MHSAQDEIAMMHPDSDVLDVVDCLRHTLHVKYNDPDLEAKAWPTLFPYGCSSWNDRCGAQLAEYQKHRLLDVDPRFWSNPFWSFFNFDRRTKRTIMGYNRCITIDPKITMAKTVGDVQAGMKRMHSDAHNTQHSDRNIRAQHCPHIQIILESAVARCSRHELRTRQTRLFHHPDDERQLARIACLYGEALTKWNKQQLRVQGIARQLHSRLHHCLYEKMGTLQAKHIASIQWSIRKSHHILMEA